MGVLISAATALVAVVLLAGCYDPDLSDCTVSCAAPDECGDGQVCGDDGFCARPSVAGTCESPAQTARLTIRIEKKGRVVIDAPAFTCDADDGAGKTCVTTVPRAGTLELRAVRTDKEFERWTTPRCMGQDETCDLDPDDDTLTVGVKFR
jgi:hypothetical protein